MGVNGLIIIIINVALLTPSARTLESTKRVMRRDAVEALESKREEDIKEFVDCITDEDVQKAIGMQIDRITKKK